MANKFFTYESTPVCTTAECTAGQVLTPTLVKLLTGVRGGSSVRLVNVTVVDYEDKGKDLAIQFFMKNAGGAIGVGGAAPNISDANLALNVPLGAVNLRHSTSGDLTASQVWSAINMDMVLTSSDDAVEGEIYYNVCAAETIDLASASSYTFRFGFEIS